MRGMCDELEFSGVGDRVVYIVFGSIEEGVINWGGGGNVWFEFWRFCRSFLWKEEGKCFLNEGERMVKVF